jgi:aspartyl-tRNA(Asn)/glutamyl-tRNA(Gln) amidotransferase subunit C
MSSQLNAQELAKLARLCRIACTEEEQKKLLHNLSRVLAYVEQLNAVDTDGVPPCTHVLEGIQCPLRSDDPGEILPRELFLANAPSHVGGMIRVPPVIHF